MQENLETNDITIDTKNNLTKIPCENIGKINGIVYKITNKINGKIYIGITTKTLEKRRQQHIQWCKHKMRKYVIHKVINKYGVDNFLFETIDNFNGNEDACEKEVKYISSYNSFIPHGYNMTLGGEGVLGHKHPQSEETKKKISLSMKGIIKSEEIKNHMKEAQKKRNEWFKFNHSIETRKIISNKMKLIPHKKMSEETKSKLRIISLGKTQSKETVEKRKRSLIGKKRSEEVKKKMSILRRNRFPIPTDICEKIKSYLFYGKTPYFISKVLLKENGYKIDKKTIKLRFANA